MKLARIVALLLIGASPPLFAQSLAKTFTLNAANQCAPIGTNNLPTVGIDVSGTFSLTLTPYVSINGQTKRASQAVPSSSSTPQATITTAGGYTDPFVGGYDNFLLCVTSYVSGSVTVWLNPSPALNASLLGGSGGAVSSVFTRTGAVTAQTGDYTVAQVTGAAPLASPALTGTPTAPTAGAITDSSQLATTAYVDTNYGDFVNSINSFGCGSETNPAQTNKALVLVDPTTSCPFLSISANITGVLLQSDSSSQDFIFDNTGGHFSNLVFNAVLPGEGNTPEINGVMMAHSPGMGVPVIVGAPATINNRGTALTTAGVFTVSTTALYRISIWVNCHTQVSTATATLTVTYVDSSGTTITPTPSPATAACTTLGAASKSGVLVTDIMSAGSITWAVAIANSPQYDARAIVEQLTAN